MADGGPGRDPDVGDPVCWLDHVCPECSAFNDDPGSPCWRCGVTAAGDETG
ncbi:MAG: hypothetical protein VYB90_14690 [Actinomycetota bacterium]|uniref:hypothetical protein n=1 Tax=Mycobacterium sp. G7A2 TaxID=3317307 RepID=UPI002EC18302|nr:hypothetical protein [Actinomycetota bacterium]|tara:strand:+ start:424 stop:576 length:153 start_codon:yes stop_codon:yes gene_type:complete